MKPLKLSLFAITLIVVAQSCVGPAYVETTPPPPQQSNYSDQGYSQQSQDAPPPVSYQTFYNELSPYGQWITTPDYGYVWIPAAGNDFQPYATNGHWVYTNYGWTWASDYNWGWAPFHYGTWDFDGTIGWFWIPGYQWSPAWVSWRSEPGYYGWAPLGPSYVNAGYANYNCPPERYVFVSATYINSPGMSAYYVPRAQNAMYFNRSAVITNTYYDRDSRVTYYAGPQSAEVERYTGPVRQLTVLQSSTPERAGASGSQISMFRPSVLNSENNAARPAPQTVYQRSNVMPLTQRQVLTQPNQARVAPFQQENIQRANPGQNRQQQSQQSPPAQQQQRPAQQQQQAPQQQYHAPAQQEQQRPAQQQAPQQQYHAPAQQEQQRPAQRQQAPQQAQQRPAQQQKPAQQSMKKQKPVKPQKPQKPAQQQQGRQ